jgi:hypothetical protein
MSKKRRQEAEIGGARSKRTTEDGNMSSPINPTQGPAGPAPVDRAAATEAAAASDARRAAPSQGAGAVEPAVSVETMPSGPPPEVLAQMSSAADAYERLAAGGQEVRFAEDGSGRGATAHLLDRQGNVLRQLSPGEAIAIALGESDPQAGGAA